MQNEKFIRVRYLRCLEKFATNVIKALKRDDFDAQKFSARVEKNEELLNRCQKATLYDSYPRALQTFVEQCIAQKGASSAKNELLRLANALEKFKKAKEYKRNKNDKNFDD